MYNFIDTTEASVGAFLPSEALKINGEYIENLIAGYRTLTVSGRESLSPELETYETGVRDGSKLKSKRYPARIIIVKFQLIAESNEAFREAFNKLGRILDVENAELIFEDEQDKFYIGTPSLIGEVEPGKNAVTGEIEFFCADPFKYSVVEYTATPWVGDTSSILINYNGTYKAYPILQAEFYGEDEAGEDGESEVALTGNGDCGYVAFFNESEKIVQLGDTDEKDGEAVAKSQTLTNQTFLSTTAWGTTAKKLWAVNTGVVNGSVQKVGNVAMKASAYPVEAGATLTSGTLLNNKQSDNGKPLFYYTVTAKTTNRTETSVKVNVTITASLGSSSSYFGYGYSLAASLYIGGAWHNVTLKTTKDWWEGKTAHSTNLTVTVTGLSATTTALTGIKFKAYRPDGVGGTAGILSETACSNLAVSQYSAATASGYYLAASSYGSGSGWHGPTITRTLSADATGEVGASNFTFTYKHKLAMASGTTSQLGAFQMHLTDANGKIVAGVHIFKNAGGKNGTLAYYVNGVQVYKSVVDLFFKNAFMGSDEKDIKTSTITKSGSKITFNIAGSKKTFTDTAIANAKVVKITFSFEQYGTKAAFAYNGLYWAKFVKNNCNTWRDVPNKFSANDIVEANCRNGQIYLNGLTTPELGALGNDWEEFYLTPGLNQIGISYSDWVEDVYKPNFKIIYREVFL
jgi:predicted phage tail component-like protein